MRGPGIQLAMMCIRVDVLLTGVRLVQQVEWQWLVETIQRHSRSSQHTQRMAVTTTTTASSQPYALQQPLRHLTAIHQTPSDHLQLQSFQQSGHQQLRWVGLLGVAEVLVVGGELLSVEELWAGVVGRWVRG